MFKLKSKLDYFALGILIGFFFMLVFRISTITFKKISDFLAAENYPVFTAGIMPPQIVSLDDVHNFIRYCAKNNAKVYLTLHDPSCFFNGNIISISEWEYYVNGNPLF